MRRIQVDLATDDERQAVVQFELEPFCLTGPENALEDSVAVFEREVYVAGGVLGQVGDLAHHHHLAERPRYHITHLSRNLADGHGIIEERALFGWHAKLG